MIRVERIRLSIRGVFRVYDVGMLGFSIMAMKTTAISYRTS